MDSYIIFELCESLCSVVYCLCVSCELTRSKQNKSVVVNWIRLAIYCYSNLAWGEVLKFSKLHFKINQSIDRYKFWQRLWFHRGSLWFVFFSWTANRISLRKHNYCYFVIVAANHCCWQINRDKKIYYTSNEITRLNDTSLKGIPWS